MYKNAEQRDLTILCFTAYHLQGTENRQRWHRPLPTATNSKRNQPTYPPLTNRHTDREKCPRGHSTTITIGTSLPGITAKQVAPHPQDTTAPIKLNTWSQFYHLLRTRMHCFTPPPQGGRPGMLSQDTGMAPNATATGNSGSAFIPQHQKQQLTNDMPPPYQSTYE